MKGLDTSISLVIALLVGIAAVVVVSTLLSGNLTGLTEFATEAISSSGGVPD